MNNISTILKGVGESDTLEYKANFMADYFFFEMEEPPAACKAQIINHHFKQDAF
jgi:hypothetical protein